MAPLSVCSDVLIVSWLPCLYVYLYASMFYASLASMCVCMLLCLNVLWSLFCMCVCNILCMYVCLCVCLQLLARLKDDVLVGRVASGSSPDLSLLLPHERINTAAQTDPAPGRGQLLVQLPTPLLPQLLKPFLSVASQHLIQWNLIAFLC